MAIAIFPGSFDPLTNGHLDLIQRALKMFDRVAVAVLVNSAKKPLFTSEERLALIRQCVPSKRVEVHAFQGLLVDFARDHGAKVIIRGLRAVSDFEYELQMAMMNRELSPDMETVFFNAQGRLLLFEQPSGQGSGRVRGCRLPTGALSHRKGTSGQVRSDQA